MDEINSIIYGLEVQSRSLASVVAEQETTNFLIGTQTLKQAENNQIHYINFCESDSTVKTTVYNHPWGEIWRIVTSPKNSQLLATCYNNVLEGKACQFHSAILRIPDETDNLQLVSELKLANSNAKTTEFHPTESNRAATLFACNFVLWDIGTVDAIQLLNISLEGKNNPQYTIGRWNPHQGSNQFMTTAESDLKMYDIRTGAQALSIENAHSQLIRDIDFNLNKQYHIATCGDDAIVNIWDLRQTQEPVYSHKDHSHWVWSVRFNPFHDQLILSASSDCRVLISSAASASSDSGVNSEIEQSLSDGPLQWCEHEDSVYCAEWSVSDPWIFASLSYDGRLLISRVKKSLKYQIML